MWWRKKRRTSAALLLAEPLEPRILYAADLAAGLMLADAADLDDSASQTRVLDAAGDYTAMPPAEVATASGSPPAAAAATQTIPTGTLPLNFEINAGQADASVDFIARGNGVGIALADGNASMLLRDGQSSHVVTMRLAGARDDASAHAEGQVTSRSNYLVGSADTWLRDVANHASVRYDGVYDGIDLRYYGSERSLQYDFIVAAGADWRRIALEFEGVQSLAIDPDGALNLTLAGADGSRSLRFTAPVSYQDGAAGREAVASRYALGEDGRVRFDIGAYDASRTLVIDPVLVYGSYLGGSGFDSARGIAVDGAGNVYLTGETASSAFPTATGAFDTSHNGGTDVYVTKLNAAGTAVIYSTFIGGSGTDSAQDIAIDAAGNAYVTGYTTSTNLPTSGAFQSARAGAQDAFFFKLNAGSTALLYSTYLGGSGGGDYGYAVALDAAGNAYVTGDTDSSSGIASSGAYDTTLGGTTDAFLVKFDPSLTGAASRVFGTYLGGSGGENGFDVAVDAAGKAHVAGYTGSSDLPTTANAYDSSVNGGGDAYVAVFNAAGSALTYSTYFGSTGTDNASAIAIGANGRIYVGGSSAGSGLPTKSAYDTTYGGGPWDAFVASFDPALSGNASLIYSTYLGGAGEDLLTDIAVDTLGRVHLTGSTTGSFSTTADAAQAAHAGGTYDAFYATLGSLGSSLVYSTYLGGSADDIGYAITRDAADRVYIAGGTGSNNLQQITSGAYDTTHNGGGDAFVLAFGNQKLTVTTTNDVVDGNTTSIAALLANKGADGLISLREAIIATNNTAGADAIALGAGTYSLARAGINENAASTGDLDITDTLSIEGAGAAATIINGAALDRVFDVRGTTLTVAGLTVRNGSASDGAGIYVDGSGTLNARDLALSSNHASGNGGALFVSGQLMLDRVTIDANTANNGGALYLNNSATATLTSTTLSGNSATAQGGAVLARGDISIVNSTIAYNSANTGSGIHKQGAAGVTLRNTILAINTGGNASGTLTSLGYNLDSDGSAGLAAAGDLNGSLATPLDPLLGTLQFNGGPTKTHALLPGSPAINAGSATGAPSTDARGAPRLGATDIGAYESTLIAYEPFAYPAGSFNGANGGSGWAAGWSNAGSDTTVDAAGLSAPGISMPVSGGTAKLSIPLIFGSVYQTRELSASLGASAGTYWLSFLVQPASTATEQFIGLGFGNPAGSRAFAGINGNQFVLEQYGGGGRVVVGGIAPVVGQTYLLALRMDMTAGADNLTLFVNPTPAQNAPDSTLTAAKNDLDLGSFTQLGIVGGRTLATNGAALDEIRLAASYLDVAPALVQHAPVLDATKSPALTAQIEDAGVPVGAVGTLVSSLVDLPGGGGLDNVTDADSGAFTGIAVTASDTASGSWWYTIDGGSNWSALGAVSGTNARLLAADANTRLYFQANANFNGTLGSALTFRAWDQTSGSNGTLASTGSNGGVTAFSSATDTASLTINAVNDAPVLAGANNLNAINEDVASGANAGTLVSALIAGQVSDLDAAASSGIAVTAVNNTNGTWQYTTNGGGLWNAFGSPGNNTARLLAADANTSVRFVPNAHWNGTVAGGITFRAWDQSAGLAGSTADTSTNGGTSAFSAATASASVTVNAVNDAPAGTDTTVTTNEDTAYTFTAASFGFTDTDDSPANALAAVRISTLPGAGTLTNNGVAVSAGQTITLADINLGRLVFTPGADANGAGHASFTFQVEDDGGTANGGIDLDASPNTLTINVTPVNDAPVGTSNTVTTNEDTAYTFTAANFGFTDPNDSPANALAAVRISTLPGAGTLTNNGVAVSAGQTITVADINLGRLVFTPGADANGAGYASFTFQVQDDGGTANGGIDLDASPNTLTVNVTAVNDAPVLAGANNLNAINEDVASGANAGTLVSALIAGQVSDLDAAASSGIAVTAVNNTNGTWQYTTNGGGLWNAFGSPGNNTARLLAADANTSVRFVPNAHWNGTVAGGITFRAWDQSAGLAGSTADTSTNGGTSAFSTATASSSITVNAVNDAPAGTDTTVTTNEDTAYTFTAANFGFTDPNDSPANTINAVRISTLPGAGTLTNNGAAVSVNQTISANDITLGRLVFTPGADASGAGYASFTFRVRDNGGTANGGVNLDPSPNTLTINVTAVNDAPVLAGANNLNAINEDVASGANAGTLVSALIAGQVSDLDAAASSGIAVTAVNNTNGTWQYTANGGGLWNAFGSPGNNTARLLAADANTSVRFVPNAHWNGTVAGGITFRAWDQGAGLAGSTADTSTSGGTSAFSAATASAIITVNAVNDAPAGTDTTVTTNEDTAYTFTAASFGFTDTDDSPANALAAVRISTLPGAGTLTNNGVAVSAGQTITLADINLGRLVFTPGADANGAGHASFTFQVEDDGGTANGGIDLDASPNTLTINVTPVNDAPAGTNATLAITESVAYGFRVSDFGLVDPNDVPANGLASVRIDSLPAAGSLTLTGVAVTAGQAVSAADIAAARLVFTPSSAGSFTLAFRVQDDGGTAGGGADTDAIARTLTLAVAAPVPTTAPPPSVIADAAAPPAPPPPATLAAALAPPSAPAAPPPVARAAVASAQPASPAEGVADAGGPGFEGLLAAADSSQLAGIARSAGAGADASAPAFIETRLVNPLSGERKAFAFESVTLVDGILSSNGRSEGSRAMFEQFLTSLRAPGFVDQLDRLREEARQEFDLERSFAITATGVTFGLSVAYVLWMVRSGVLMGSLLSSLPAWRMLDPLPVLSRGGDDEADDELFDTPPEETDPAREALRGY